MNGRRRAVLVGCEQYPHAAEILSPLRCPRADVAAMAEQLKDDACGPFNDIYDFVDKDHYLFSTCINEILTQADPNDLVLFYFSGHGKLDVQGDLHLCSYNTRASALQSTSLPTATLHTFVKKSRCATVVIILDCCFSGAIGRDLIKSGVDEPLQRLVRDSESGRGIFVLTSSSDIQTSKERDGDDNGLFTKCLIRGLKTGEADDNSDGMITIDELARYVRQATSGEGQTPWFYSIGATGQTVLATLPGKRRQHDPDVIKAHLRVLCQAGVLPLFILEDVEELLRQASVIEDRRAEVALNLLNDLYEHRLEIVPFLDSWLRHRSQLPGTDRASSVRPEDRWELTRHLRGAAFDVMVPAYLLDRWFHFVDWNSAFDELVAKPRGLVRGRHAEEFVLALENATEVVERSLRVFGPERAPLVDIETLKYPGGKYGTIEFEKLAAQVTGDDGELQAWVVTLDILSAGEPQLLWSDLGHRLSKDVNWSMYAGAYDRMLSKFREYRLLRDRLCEMIGDAHRCADLGAGTGNGAIELLRRDPNRQVWAFEANDRMLQFLEKKITGTLRQRISIVKGDMSVSVREFDQGFFDAGMMMNSLYAVNDRQGCLCEIGRVIKPGGKLVISTPHADTDIYRLFAKIREDIADQNMAEELNAVIDFALTRHEQMIDDIRKDTLADIMSYVEAAGFEVRTKPELAYVDAVYIIEAFKR